MSSEPTRGVPVGRGEAPLAQAPSSEFKPLRPAADAVRRRILAAIATGVLIPGQRLGAERNLAEQYGVSRATLRAALEALQSEGAVDRVLGRSGGTFIAARRVERDLTTMSGLPAYLRRQGFQAGTRVLSSTTRSAGGDEVDRLELEGDPMVFEVVRIRLADGEPISLERAVFPADRFPGLLDQPLGGSLYALAQEQYGVMPGEALERIEVISAPATAARLLAVRRAAPLVSVDRVAKDVGGRPFECSVDLFRADRVRIVVRAQAADGGAAMAGGALEAAGMEW
jgi:GntR family transcriptional regulator